MLTGSSLRKRASNLIFPGKHRAVACPLAPDHPRITVNSQAALCICAWVHVLGWLYDLCHIPHTAIRSEPSMNLGDLTNFVEKPFAAMSNVLNTPNSAGRYRPFYLRNLLDAVQGRTLEEAVDGTITLLTG